MRGTVANPIPAQKRAIFSETIPASSLLYGAIQTEQASIRKYRSQCLWIRDSNVVENLQRILQDEESHIEILTCLREKYAHAGR